MSDPRNQSIGIHLVDCEDVCLHDNVFSGFDRAVVAERTKRIRATGNTVLSNVPPDLINAVIDAVAKGRSSGAKPTPEDVDKALSGTMRAWLLEHGVDLAAFAVAVAGLLK